MRPVERAAAALICACTVAACAAEAADLPASLVVPYLRIQTSLARDNIDGVKTEASAIAAAAEGLGAQAREVAETAHKLERTADLKATRAAFGSLSEAVVAYAKATGATFGTDVHQAFCPMVGKPWLQQGEKIRNPYYGTEMSECGELKR
jgi:hypothetical protein